MQRKLIRPDRRVPRRWQERVGALAESVAEEGWEERRVHCWHMEKDCTEERRMGCAAFFIRKNCWDLWALEFFPLGRKPCCHPELDCSDCPVATGKFGETVSVFVELPSRERSREASPRDRQRVNCPDLYSTKDVHAAKGGDPSRPVFRCRQRSTVQLDVSYISQVCNRPDHRDCPFFS